MTARVKGKQKESPWQALRAGVVLGTEAFLERGDWGRDLVLAMARRHCAMTFKGLGKAAGGARSVAVK